jgi:hypothetical protein
MAAVKTVRAHLVELQTYINDIAAFTASGRDAFSADRMA